ncbi:uncharacterized protein SPPG_01448 [Spizellomyces punctatus DAOM BR117]|uniref:Uncharacterized protein n=1 Tax=Spizellomyces punctatus (strain DAOM BR117) TaxID=645134 RepID=A0A0L0HSX1_SPIPD|nr:uncharacterized protein SPPG_01448 [Spizellomyces punctatus DAOM BR117]KND04000.1 hypothetical protein SPPG_01448 [Spizellomyces punctatus DAOM BR117]|eukprot:XP_016612039.1 hypothetical protein SPPG_01448 [Spizellomyces punctatus DAOM BR117]
MQFHNGTDWNRHHGVGATLLENWVEERAVGDRVLDEREDIANLSKNGHRDILIHGLEKQYKTTTQREAHKPFNVLDKNVNHLGKRSQLVEENLLKKAIEDVKDTPLDRSAKGWISTHQADFAHEDVYGTLKELGSEPPSEADKARFAHPITFWSDSAVKGNGTTISSTPTKDLQRLRTPNGTTAPGHASAAAVSFGKHSDFSTPIQEYVKASIKDL